MTHLNNDGASNWDKESIEANWEEIQTNVINKKYKPFITLSSDSLNFSVTQDDHFTTPQEVDYGVITATIKPAITSQISVPAIATLQTRSFISPCTLRSFHSNSVVSLLFCSKLDSLTTKAYSKRMPMKSFFIDELHTIKNDSLRSAKIPKHFN